MKEAFYVLHHLKGFVADAEMMRLPPSMRDPEKWRGRSVMLILEKTSIASK
jgi:hypothetical protein